MATLEELETHWGFLDVVRANEVLDAWYDAERRAQKKAEEEAKNAKRP